MAVWKRPQPVSVSPVMKTTVARLLAMAASGVPSMLQAMSDSRDGAMSLDSWEVYDSNSGCGWSETNLH